MYGMENGLHSRDENNQYSLFSWFWIMFLFLLLFMQKIWISLNLIVLPNKKPTANRLLGYCWKKRWPQPPKMLEIKSRLINCFWLNFLFLFFLRAAELKMDVLRERECKDSMERQLADERKLRGKSMSPFSSRSSALEYLKMSNEINSNSVRWNFVNSVTLCGFLELFCILFNTFSFKINFQSNTRVDALGWKWAKGTALKKKLMK